MKKEREHLRSGIETYLTVGDLVTKRGSEGGGTVIDINALWVSIKWDADNPPKPKICHARELEKVPEQA